MTDTTQAVELPAPDANVEVNESYAENQRRDQEAIDEAESSPAKVESKPEPDPVDKVRSRIDELTRLRREAERDRDFYREQALRLQQPQEKATEPAPVSKSKTLADFQYDEGQYQEYLFQEAEKRAVTAAEKRLREQQEKDTANRRKSEFERKEADFAKTVDDYHEVTRSASLPVTAEMAQVIAESDDGPALAYYLGKNIAIAEQISSMPPLAAARELGRIEMKLAAEREKAKEKPVSKAPPPTPKLEAAEADFEKNPDEMSIEEWKKWRDKRDRARKR